jgi:putative oxidoreductase
MNRSPQSAEYGIASLRIVVGAVFAAHGAQKLFSFGIPGVAGFLAQAGIPFPTLSAVAVTAAELLGGLALVAGLFTRWSAVPLAFTMLVAVVAVHLKGGFFLPNGVEYALTLLAASAALALTGGGALSVDGWRTRRADGTLREDAELDVRRPARVH